MSAMKLVMLTSDICHQVVEMSRGKGQCVLRDLRPGTMYRMYAIGANDFGDSPRSKELWFRTVDGEIEKRIS